MVKNRGVILLNVVMMLLTIALIGASLVSFFSLVNLSARTGLEEARAFYLAEAGISHAVNTLRNIKAGSGKPVNKIGPISFGGGSYEAEMDISQFLIISTGRVGSSSKTLQLRYDAF